MYRVSVNKTTGKLIEIQSGGWTEDEGLAEARLNTLKQNALNAGYTENDIEVKWATDEEYEALSNPPLTTEEIKKNYENLVDRHIDSVAKEKGYARIGVSPSVSCLGYASFSNPWQAEAITFGEWIASLWPALWQIQADVESGARTLPTEAELIAELPTMVWPE